MVSWTTGDVLVTVAVFGLAGLCEIGGGWLVWQSVRENKPWWWAVLGGLVLVIYGFVPCLQPVSNFGRVYGAHPSNPFILNSYAAMTSHSLADLLFLQTRTWLRGCTLKPPYMCTIMCDFCTMSSVYGGFFITLSYVWGWIVDNVRPDKGDIIGSCVALVGVCIAMFWPRDSTDADSKAFEPESI